MKRFLGILVLVLIAAAALFLILRRPPLEIPPTEKAPPGKPAAQLVPDTTLAFVHIPDGKRLRAELRTLELYKLWRDPQMEALRTTVKTSMQQATARKADAAGKWKQFRQLISLMQGEAFVAVTDVDPAAIKEQRTPVSVVV
jgi:hypothetical protein